MSERALELFKEAMARQAQGYNIELDCPPGGIRPGDLIVSVLEGTGLPIREPIAKVFGNWTYDFSDVEGIAEKWPEVRAIVKPRIEALYNNGTIRYGSW